MSIFEALIHQATIIGPRDDREMSLSPSRMVHSLFWKTRGLHFSSWPHLL